jgi:hypothetical protein
MQPCSDQKTLDIGDLQARLDILRNEWSGFEWHDAACSLSSPFDILQEQVRRVVREAGYDMGPAARSEYEASASDEDNYIRVMYGIPRILVIIQIKTSRKDLGEHVTEYTESLGCIRAVKLE